jgi:hypothetical protein
MEIAALTAFLAPALSFLLGIGNHAADEAAKTLGDATWEQARKLWGRLRGKVEADPATLAAAEQLAAQPADSGARTVLSFLLSRALADDPELAALLEEDWKSARTQTTAIASAERAVALSGENSGNVIITGDRGGPDG